MKPISSKEIYNYLDFQIGNAERDIRVYEELGDTRQADEARGRVQALEQMRGFVDACNSPF